VVNEMAYDDPFFHCRTHCMHCPVRAQTVSSRPPLQTLSAHPIFRLSGSRLFFSEATASRHPSTTILTHTHTTHTLTALTLELLRPYIASSRYPRPTPVLDPPLHSSSSTAHRTVIRRWTSTVLSPYHRSKVLSFQIPSPCPPNAAPATFCCLSAQLRLFWPSSSWV
jgi:hypothetical protein